jgi:hypothetical protein
VQLVISRQTDAVLHLREQKLVKPDVIDAVAHFRLSHAAFLSHDSKIVCETELHSIGIKHSIDFLQRSKDTAPFRKTFSLVGFNLGSVIGAIEAFASSRSNEDEVISTVICAQLMQDASRPSLVYSPNLA